MALQLHLASSSWAPSDGLVIFRATHAWPPTPALEPQEVLGFRSQGGFWIQPASGSRGDSRLQPSRWPRADTRHPCVAPTPVLGEDKLLQVTPERTSR